MMFTLLRHYSHLFCSTNPRARCCYYPLLQRDWVPFHIASQSQSQDCFPSALGFMPRDGEINRSHHLVFSKGSDEQGEGRSPRASLGAIIPSPCMPVCFPPWEWNRWEKVLTGRTENIECQEENALRSASPSPTGQTGKLRTCNVMKHIRCKQAVCLVMSHEKAPFWRRILTRTLPSRERGDS